MSYEVNPYADTVHDYLFSGWTALPLPYAQKSAPPEGYTGKDAKEVSAAKMKEWMKQRSNVALRMPKGVIGIDIDRNKETGAPDGWDLLQKLQAELGELPIDIVSTSREDLKCGFTAFFRVPELAVLNGGIGGVIDIIQEAHRYQVVYPSVHPDSGRTYEWREFATNKKTLFFPAAEMLPDLPEAWLEYLSKVTTAPVRTSYNPHTALPADAPLVLSGASCANMRTNAGRRINELYGATNVATSRHDAMVRATYILVLAGHSGHSGLNQALEEYFTAWKNKFSKKEQEERSLRAEFDSAVYSAKGKMLGSQKGTCCCREARRGSAYTKVRSMADVNMWR